MSRIISLLFVILLFLPATVFSQDNISGRFIGKNNIPMKNGHVLIWDAASGPPPLMERYFRIPEYGAEISSGGLFTAAIPPGQYYIGAGKELADDWDGPMVEGSLLSIISNDQGLPQRFEVTADKMLEIGTDRNAEPYFDRFATDNIVAVTGQVRFADGRFASDIVFEATPPGGSSQVLFTSRRSDEQGHYILRVDRAGIFEVSCYRKEKAFAILTEDDRGEPVVRQSIAVEFIKEKTIPMDFTIQ